MKHDVYHIIFNKVNGSIRQVLFKTIEKTIPLLKLQHNFLSHLFHITDTIKSAMESTTKESP